MRAGVPIQTILVPLDGSALAEQVVPYVRVLAHILAARVHLLRVITKVEEQPLIARYAAEPAAHGVTVETDWQWEHHAVTELEQVARNNLTAQAETLRAAGVAVTVEVSTDAPAETIVEAAANRPNVLIAMTTHRYHGLERWAAGSVADTVVHATSAPVFLVRGADSPPARPWTVRRILVPVDGSALARQALPIARTLAMCAGAELILLQAIVPPAGWLALHDAERKPVQRWLAVLVEQLHSHRLPITPVLAMGDPVEVIRAEAVRRAVDVIVLATHSYCGLTRRALGSVADMVLHATSTPLLLVRPHGQHQMQATDAAPAAESLRSGASVPEYSEPTPAVDWSDDGR